MKPVTGGTLSKLIDIETATQFQIAVNKGGYVVVQVDKRPVMRSSLVSCPHCYIDEWIEKIFGKSKATLDKCTTYRAELWQGYGLLLKFTRNNLSSPWRLQFNTPSKRAAYAPPQCRLHIVS